MGLKYKMVRQFKSFLVLSFLFSIFLVFPSKAFAGTCSGVAFNPTSGDNTTVFTLRASGCRDNAGNLRNGAFVVNVIAPDGSTFTSATGDSVNGVYTTTFSGFTAQGVYTAQVTDPDFANVGSATVTITTVSTQTFACGAKGLDSNANCDPKCPASLDSTADNGTFWCACGQLNLGCCPASPRCGGGTGNITCNGGMCRYNGSATAFTGTCETAGIDTAIGCVPLGSLNEFAGFFFGWGLGIAGGVGFLFLIYASFVIMTSSGDPKRLQTGQELLVSAVSGIILLIFSVFVLRVIGVNLLGLFG